MVSKVTMTLSSAPASKNAAKESGASGTGATANASSSSASASSSKPPQRTIQVKIGNQTAQEMTPDQAADYLKWIAATAAASSSAAAAAAAAAAAVSSAVSTKGGPPPLSSSHRTPANSDPASYWTTTTPNHVKMTFHNNNNNNTSNNNSNGTSSNTASTAPTSSNGNSNGNSNAGGNSNNSADNTSSSSSNPPTTATLQISLPPPPPEGTGGNNHTNNPNNPSSSNAAAAAAASLLGPRRKKSSPRHHRHPPHPAWTYFSQAAANPTGGPSPPPPFYHGNPAAGTNAGSNGAPPPPSMPCTEKEMKALMSMFVEIMGLQMNTDKLNQTKSKLVVSSSSQHKKKDNDDDDEEEEDDDDDEEDSVDSVPPPLEEIPAADRAQRQQRLVQQQQQQLSSPSQNKLETASTATTTVSSTPRVAGVFAGIAIPEWELLERVAMEDALEQEERARKAASLHPPAAAAAAAAAALAHPTLKGAAAAAAAAGAPYNPYAGLAAYSSASAAAAAAAASSYHRSKSSAAAVGSGGVSPTGTKKSTRGGTAAASAAAAAAFLDTHALWTTAAAASGTATTTNTAYGTTAAAAAAAATLASHLDSYSLFAATPTNPPTTDGSGGHSLPPPPPPPAAAAAAAAALLAETSKAKAKKCTAWRHKVVTTACQREETPESAASRTAVLEALLQDCPLAQADRDHWTVLVPKDDRDHWLALVPYTLPLKNSQATTRQILRDFLAQAHPPLFVQALPHSGRSALHTACWMAGIVPPSSTTTSPDVQAVQDMVRALTTTSNNGGETNRSHKNKKNDKARKPFVREQSLNATCLESGWTALQYAALAGNAMAVQILLKAGADLEARSNESHTWQGDRGVTVVDLLKAALVQTQTDSKSTKHTVMPCELETHGMAWTELQKALEQEKKRILYQKAWLQIWKLLLDRAKESSCPCTREFRTILEQVPEIRIPPSKMVSEEDQARPSDTATSRAPTTANNSSTAELITPGNTTKTSTGVNAEGNDDSSTKRKSKKKKKKGGTSSTETTNPNASNILTESKTVASPDPLESDPLTAVLVGMGFPLDQVLTGIRACGGADRATPDRVIAWMLDPQDGDQEHMVPNIVGDSNPASDSSGTVKASPVKPQKPVVVENRQAVASAPDAMAPSKRGETDRQQTAAAKREEQRRRNREWNKKQEGAVLRQQQQQQQQQQQVVVAAPLPTVTAPPLKKRIPPKPQPPSLVPNSLPVAATSTAPFVPVTTVETFSNQDGASTIATTSVVDLANDDATVSTLGSRTTTTPVTTPLASQSTFQQLQQPQQLQAQPVLLSGLPMTAINPVPPPATAMPPTLSAAAVNPPIAETKPAQPPPGFGPTESRALHSAPVSGLGYGTGNGLFPLQGLGPPPEQTPGLTSFPPSNANTTGPSLLSSNPLTSGAAPVMGGTATSSWEGLIPHLQRQPLSTSAPTSAETSLYGAETSLFGNHHGSQPSVPPTSSSGLFGGPPAPSPSVSAPSSLPFGLSEPMLIGPQTIGNGHGLLGSTGLSAGSDFLNPLGSTSTSTSPSAVLGGSSLWGGSGLSHHPSVPSTNSLAADTSFLGTTDARPSPLLLGVLPEVGRDHGEKQTNNLFGGSALTGSSPGWSANAGTTPSSVSNHSIW